MAEHCTELRDGTTGYTMRRDDDCFAPALATLLQVPVDEIPDPRLDARRAAGETVDAISRGAWGAWEAWLAERGLRLRLHQSPPVSAPRWLAVCREPDWRRAWSEVAKATQAAREEIAKIPAAHRAQVSRAYRKRHAEVTAKLAFADHTVIFAFDELWFDPMIGITPPPGQRHRRWRLEDVLYGMTIEEGVQ